jgi:hypothetical protein
MRAYFSDRRGTAALEFALVLPVLVALALGLVGNVRRSLAEIDADAAAGAAALVVLERGYAPEVLAAAARAADPLARVDDIRLIDCQRACAALPAGRYASITISREAGSLLRPLQAEVYQSTAIVRLPDRRGK